MQFSKIEIILLLAYYKIDKRKNIDAFTAQFNRYFKKDVSSQTLLFLVSSFKYIDPAYNMHHSSSSQTLDNFIEVWNEYIVGEKTIELRNIYKSFKKGSYVNLTMDETICWHQSNPEEINDYTIYDFPKDVPECIDSGGQFLYPRDRMVVEHALQLANHNCEALCENKLFTSKGQDYFYTEAHHIVPLASQPYFNVSLDVEANVVSLCPNCHSLLHYGEDKVMLLKHLYNMRNTRLEKCGIKISFEELLLLYR